MEELRNQVQTEVGSMKQEENLLLKLIKQRKVQPKTRLQKGWKISCWISRGNNGRGPNEQTYERFNFEKVKPDGEFVTKKGQFNRGFALRNHHEIKNFCAPSMKGLRRMNRRRFWNRRHYDGHETLIRVQGVFIAPKTGTLRFHTNTDDGSYLYLGDFRKHMVVNNGRLHGMRVRNGQMPAKKGEHLPFIFTFYEHHGHGAAYLTAKMGRTFLAPFYYDNRLNKLMGLRKIRKNRRVSKGKRVVFKRKYRKTSRKTGLRRASKKIFTRSKRRVVRRKGRRGGRKVRRFRKTKRSKRRSVRRTRRSKKSKKRVVRRKGRKVRRNRRRGGRKVRVVRRKGRKVRRNRRRRGGRKVRRTRRKSKKVRRSRRKTKRSSRKVRRSKRRTFFKRVKKHVKRGVRKVSRRVNKRRSV